MVPAVENKHDLTGRRRKRVFASHLLITIGGWLLFLWWWFIVLRRLTAAEAVYIVVFLVVVSVIIITTTIAWISHNVRIFHRKGPRKTAWTAPEDFSRDTVGRRNEFHGGMDALRQEPVVLITIDGQTKRYSGEAPNATPLREPAAVSS